MPERVRTLGEIAELVRSKNAGPFWITIDAFFTSDADYELVTKSVVVNRTTIAGLYQADPALLMIYRLPSIRVIKVSFPRPVVQGSFTDRDIHSGQQHIPLAGLRIPAAGHPLRAESRDA
ncbi:DUF4387 domain-containing protein [Amycolatopsis pigmentata]|uniref:DUF4387 domain-containing protein n=1 Tax=Amycolatopsis pigmentata TaxID=450801 RepID=A0ABW5FNG5_9PSEU